jgi:hypothetical protein
MALFSGFTNGINRNVIFGSIHYLDLLRHPCLCKIKLKHSILETDQPHPEAKKKDLLSWPSKSKSFFSSKPVFNVVKTASSLQ